MVYWLTVPYCLRWSHSVSIKLLLSGIRPKLCHFYTDFKRETFAVAPTQWLWMEFKLKCSCCNTKTPAHIQKGPEKISWEIGLISKTQIVQLQFSQKEKHRQRHISGGEQRTKDSRDKGTNVRDRERGDEKVRVRSSECLTAALHPALIMHSCPANWSFPHIPIYRREIATLLFGNEPTFAKMPQIWHR